MSRLSIRHYGKAIHALAIALALGIVLLSLFQSLLYGLVLVEFVLIVFEGILITLSVLSATNLSGDHITKKRNNDSENSSIERSDIISATRDCVNYAASGSDFSRREVARVLRIVLLQKIVGSHKGKSSPSKKRVEKLMSDEQFKSDLKHVVSPYVADPSFDWEQDDVVDSSEQESEIKNAPSKPVKENKESDSNREAYLSSLERIISELS